MKSVQKILLIGVALLGLLIPTGCSGSEDSGSDAGGSQETLYLSFGTGGVAGTYYALGGAFSSIINNKMTNINCSVESTGGAVANTLLIANGESEIAFSAASTLYDAVNRNGVFANEANLDKVMGVISLYPEAVQIVGTNPEIQSVNDLKGKRVAVGSPGSGTEVMANTILSVYGLSYDDIEEDFLGFGDATNGLKDNTLDVGFIWAGVPTSGILDLGAKHSLSFINFSDEDIEMLTAITPYCVPLEIDKSIYSSMIQESVTLVSVPAILIASSDLTHDFVYEFLQTVFNSSDILSSTHQRGADITIETALQGLEELPLHPGAETFYKEQGVL